MCTILNLKQMNKQVTYQILKWNPSQMFSKSFRQFPGWRVYIWKILSTPYLFITHTKSILNSCGIKVLQKSRHAK